MERTGRSGRRQSGSQNVLYERKKILKIKIKMTASHPHPSLYIIVACFFLSKVASLSKVTFFIPRISSALGHIKT